MHRSVVFFAIALVVACHNTPPEGVYPCRQATVAHDCPELWYCRRDNLCWITDDPDAGVTGGDAGMPVVDAGPDAARDTGPHCASETCNGMDDDCDGLIDEGVITVGPAVVATTTSHQLAAAFIPTSAGFGAVALSVAGTTPTAAWVTLDAAGSPISGPTLAASLANNFVTDAIGVGSNVLIAGGSFSDGTIVFSGFDRGTGNVAIAATPLPFEAGSSAGFGRFSQASSTRVTVYATYYPASGTAVAIRRFRIDVSGSIPSLLDARDIATDLDNTIAFAVLGTSGRDYVLYSRGDGRTVLLAGTAGDGTAAFQLVGLVGDATSPRMDYGALAIRDTSLGVSPSNPLGVVWSGRNTGNPPRATLTFAEITNTTVLTTTTPISLPDAYGAWGSSVIVRTVLLLAVPDAPEHWIIANQDTDSAAPPTGGLLQVREVIGAGTNVRRLSVPGALIGPEGNIGIVTSGGATRILETNASSLLVTRSIGCE